MENLGNYIVAFLVGVEVTIVIGAVMEHRRRAELERKRKEDK